MLPVEEQPRGVFSHSQHLVQAPLPVT